VDAVFVAYTLALYRRAHPREATPGPGTETVRELLLRSRRFVVPAVAVVAVGAIVFGGVVLAGRGDDHADDRAGAAVDGSSGTGAATSEDVRTPHTTTEVTLPQATTAPAASTAPVTTPVSSPSTSRATFPARTLPPVTTAPTAVVPAQAPAPPTTTTPAAPPTTQPPNLFCALLHAFC
jgi:hypothetical protein